MRLRSIQRRQLAQTLTESGLSWQDYQQARAMAREIDPSPYTLINYSSSLGKDYKGVEYDRIVMDEVIEDAFKDHPELVRRLQKP